MSDTTFHVRYRMTYAITLSDDPCAAPLRYPREWTEDYGSADDFRRRIGYLTSAHGMHRDALGDPDADGSWSNGRDRLSWWIV